MSRERLIELAEKYERRGKALHDVMGVEREELGSWLRGRRIPRARVQQLEWWDGMLRAEEALEASGLPECAELQALERRASTVILRRAPTREQDEVARDVLRHQASCRLCRDRDAVRSSAGPFKGSAFPESVGNRRAQASLRMLPLLAGAIVVWPWASDGTIPGENRYAFLAGLLFVVPVLLWDQVSANHLNRAAAFLSVSLGCAMLATFDRSAVLAAPWNYVPVAIVIAAMACIGILAARVEDS